MAVIDIFDKETGDLIGTITEADLDVLRDKLEETSSEDQDYYLDMDTIEFLADGDASDHLVELLRKALGSRESVEIRWEKR